MESVYNLNRKLVDTYGKFDTTDYPLFRVVWSNDEYERRLITHTKDGFELANPAVLEVPKYKQWAADRYILESLVGVPEEQQFELGGRKFSYEPIWVFEDKDGNALPPIWGAIWVIIKSIQDKMDAARDGTPKYKDPYAGLTTPELIEAEKARLDGLEKELFGNENKITDALAQDSAVGYGVRQRNDKVN
jgi:hypothetical protein